MKTCIGMQVREGEVHGVNGCGVLGLGIRVLTWTLNPDVQVDQADVLHEHSANCEVCPF